MNTNKPTTSPESGTGRSRVYSWPATILMLISLPLSLLLYAIAFFLAPVGQLTMDEVFDDGPATERSRRLWASQVIASSMPPIRYEYSIVGLVLRNEPRPPDPEVVTQWANNETRRAYQWLATLATAVFVPQLFLWLAIFLRYVSWTKAGLVRLALTLLLLSVCVIGVLAVLTPPYNVAGQLFEEVSRIQLTLKQVTIHYNILATAGVSLALAAVSTLLAFKKS